MLLSNTVLKTIDTTHTSPDYGTIPCTLTISVFSYIHEAIGVEDIQDYTLRAWYPTLETSRQTGYNLRSEAEKALSEYLSIEAERRGGL